MAQTVAKQVAAPPEDVVSGLVRLPEPREVASTSRAFARELVFAREGDAWVAELPLELATEGRASVAWSAPDLSGWRVSLRDATGALHELEAVLGASEKNGAVLVETLPGWIAERRDFAGAPRGAWTARFEVAARASEPRGLFVVRDAADAELAAWVDTFTTVAGEPLVVLAEFADSTARDTLEGSVEFEAGPVKLIVPLADDGEHADGAAHDGRFGAFVPRELSGSVVATVELVRGARDAARTSRTARLAFDVLERRTLLDGSVTASVHDPLRVRLDLGAFALGPAAKLLVAAEVWGSDSNGAPVPVCWLARMVEPAGEGTWQLPLFLDVRWLAQSRALPPFELREVRVQDPDRHVVFDRRERLPFELGSLPRGFFAPSSSVTAAMLMGPGFSGASSAGGHGLGTRYPTDRGLVLTHGYCSSGSIWPAADFTQPKVEFLDPNANRTHDQFAQLLAQTGSTFGSFGVVGHSQGGCAALHLLTYYTSGLDFAYGPRKIQSVATPYQGTPLASWGGFACGTNNDMVPANSAVWLAGIPSWARAEVYYWTTSNSGSACNFFTNLLLSDPEDGTVEQARGQLSGANSMGHVVGWCHTTGMSNPANYTDHARNQQMNTFAAR
ncbi:MAG: hypothetical protein L6Q99_09900 [Planctomycetes bacterium]|nr:hypothetical protein [Planctomycetota bacterium]